MKKSILVRVSIAGSSLGKEEMIKMAQKAVIDAGARWTLGREKLNSRAIIS